MANPRRILVVEDERDLAEMLGYNLKKAGYTPVLAHDGQKALQLATPPSPVPDLILLDVMLPGVPGLEVARRLRSAPPTTNIPIIMLTARAEEADQIAGLGAGADDYITKPFSTRVLLARVEAMLRRTAPTGEEGPSGTLTVGMVTIDLASHTVIVEGEPAPAKVTLTEFKLLAAMMAGSKRVLGRAELIAKVMGPGIIITARTIDVHVASIRRKLGPAGGQIRTIRGVGYQLSAQIHADAKA